MIRRMGKKVDPIDKPQHEIIVTHDNGQFSFVFKYGTLGKVYETIRIGDGKVTQLVHLTQEEFIDVFRRMTPNLWGTEYERGVAKCRLHEILKML